MRNNRTALVTLFTIWLQKNRLRLKVPTSACWEIELWETLETLVNTGMIDTKYQGSKGRCQSSESSDLFTVSDWPYTLSLGLRRLFVAVEFAVASTNSCSWITTESRREYCIVWAGGNEDPASLTSELGTRDAEWLVAEVGEFLPS